MFDDTFGVWANRDCELVRTPAFSILFERDGENVIAALVRHQAQGSAVLFDTRAMFLFDGREERSLVRAKGPISGDELVLDTDRERQLTLGEHLCELGVTPDGVTLGIEGAPVEELVREGTLLKLLTPGGRWQELEPLERIVPAEPYDASAADKDNVAACLQEWALGTSAFRSPETDFVTMNIGTNRHAFALGYGIPGPEPVVYCRAARVRSSNNGVVFSQNVRLVDAGEELTAYMAEDNLAAAAAPLAISNAAFGEPVCDPTGAGLYWALDGFEKDRIVLRGAGDKEFRFERPLRDSPLLLERFRFQDYTEADARQG
jgi:hypothetical protein